MVKEIELWVENKPKDVWLRLWLLIEIVQIVVTLFVQRGSEAERRWLQRVRGIAGAIYGQA